MADTRKVTVLLADDESHIRTLLKGVILSMNCTVVGEAAHGGEATELFKQKKPDITLLDINMPVVDGVEALRAIRKQAPSAFVIMLTSLSTTEAVEECLEAGANDFIRKDTPIPELRRLIRESWLEHLQSQADGGA